MKNSNAAFCLSLLLDAVTVYVYSVGLPLLSYFTFSLAVIMFACFLVLNQLEKAIIMGNWSVTVDTSFTGLNKID